VKLTKGVIVAVAGADRHGWAGPDSTAAAAPLLPVGNRPIVVHALERLGAAGIEEVAVVAPAGLAAQLRSGLGDTAAGVRVRHLCDERERGLPGALAAAGDFVGEDSFVMQVGDGLLGGELEPFVALVGGGRPDAVLLVHRDPAADDAARLESRRMLRMAQVEVDPAGLAVAGLSLFGRGALAQARAALAPGAAEAQLADTVEALWRSGGHVHVRMVHDWRRYAGEVQDLLDLNRMVLEEVEADREPLSGAGTRIQGRVAVHPTARVRASVVRGPVVIGPRARVEDAYVGPYTAIGADVLVEGAEIENSIVLDGASICHIGGRLEASVVGRGARVFRDFSLPRALRLHVGDGGEVALC
jgi:glucose-1-phosphate thymidylyltransferase